MGKAEGAAWETAGYPTLVYHYCRFWPVSLKLAAAFKPEISFSGAFLAK